MNWIIEAFKRFFAHKVVQEAVEEIEEVVADAAIDYVKDKVQGHTYKAGELNVQINNVELGNIEELVAVQKQNVEQTVKDYNAKTTKE